VGGGIIRSAPKEGELTGTHPFPPFEGASNRYPPKIKGGGTNLGAPPLKGGYLIVPLLLRGVLNTTPFIKGGNYLSTPLF
jgi:hypothetical protein